MKNVYILFLSLCLSTSAFAFSSAPHSDRDHRGDHDQDSGLQHLSFEDFKAACLTPAKFHNQTAPSNIQISCSDLQTKWVPDTQGAYAMGATRQVTATLSSDKYTVDNISAEMPAAQESFACPQYKEISESVNTVQAVTCDDITGYKGGVTDYCGAAVDAVRTANPQAVTALATGRTFSMCGGSAAQEAPAQVSQK